VETAPFIPYTRDACVNNDNNAVQHSCQTFFNYNGHGTDTWFEKSMGRDANGNQSVWIEGPHVSRTC
jgi:hypothetical protein